VAQLAKVKARYPQVYLNGHVLNTGQNCGLTQLAVYTRWTTPIPDGKELSKICGEPINQAMEKEEGREKKEMQT
jgi:hypothetical protein